MLEGIENRARFSGLAVGTMLDPLDQHAAHGAQISNAGIEIGDLGFGQGARLIPIMNGVQSEQLGNLLQCEAQTLRPADKAQPVTIRNGITANRPVLAFRHRQQTTPLVVAHSFDMDISGLRQFANRQRNGFFMLDSVLRYRGKNSSSNLHPPGGRLMSSHEHSCKHEHHHAHSPDHASAHPAKSAKPVPQGAFYTCPMHPEIRREGPGSCPKCGMALEPEGIPAPVTKTEYTCPMHPEIVQDEPGSCPKCGMALEPRTVTLEEEENPELKDMTRRFWISVLLTVPLVMVVMGKMIPGVSFAWLGSPRALGWLELLLATPVVLWGGCPFFVRGGSPWSTAA